MATILVDYENVCSTNGLKGIEYLNEKDTLTIFYSKSNEKIRSEYIDAIEKSGSEFKIRKLLNPGKNALDFYIASECGFISQNGENQIAIISNDKGFHAVSDYFNINAEIEGTSVVIASNIENALMLLNAPDDNIRRQMLHKRSKPLDIATEHARIQAHIAMRRKIISAFEDTEFKNLSSTILSYIEENQYTSPKLLYTSSLHNFGRTNGTTIYKILKDIIFPQKNRPTT